MHNDRIIYEYISKKNNDTIIEWKVCPRTNQEFPIFQKDKEVIEKLSPTIGSKKYLFPLPTLSPKAREQRRMMFKNERTFHKDVCEHTQKPTISRFTNKHVFSNLARHSDDRNQKFIDYNGTQSIKECMERLCNNTIYQDLIGSSQNVTNNAKYTNHASKQSNTYLLVNARDDEYCAYGNFINHCKRCFDNIHIANSEHCYQCVSGENLFKCMYTYNCLDSDSLLFCSNMKGCKNCFLCSGLNNQSYCIRNKKVSKEQYENYIKELNIESYKNTQTIYQEYEHLLKNQLQPATMNQGSENIIGHECNNSSNCFLSFELQSCQDIRYSTMCFESQDLMDITSFGESSFQMYEGLSVGKNSSHIYCSSMIGESHNLLYCMETKYCNNCFGCVNLYQKDYCIFNKQYTKEEYEIIVPKLIQELEDQGLWGEFLNSQLSPFPYNDSMAIDYYPPYNVIDVNGIETIYDTTGKGTVYLKDNNEVAKAIFNRGNSRDIPITRRIHREEINIPENAITINAYDLPDTITQVNEDIVNKVIICEDSQRPFRINSIEYEFHKKHNIPLPRKHPDIRYKRLFDIRPGRTLYIRNCDQTNEPIISVYGSNYQGKVYSTEAYQQEIYS